jgi:hypothetical protein
LIIPFKVKDREFSESIKFFSSYNTADREYRLSISSMRTPNFSEEKASKKINDPSAHCP